MTSSGRSSAHTPPSADDLLVLLAVGRSGRFTAAADSLGVNHTTVSRRIASLEKSLGGRVLVRTSGGWELTDLGRHALAAAETVDSVVRGLVDPGGASLRGVVRISATDGFSAYIAAPAAVSVQERHPEVSVELVAATRRASQQRSGMDIEIVVGTPQVHRAEAVHLGEYCLGLYATPEYLEHHDTITTRRDLAGHPLVYFVESMLHVDDLDLARSVAVGDAPPSSDVPVMRSSVSSTNVFVHVEATRAGAGIGLLPCFMADRHRDLVRILRSEVSVTLAYWLVVRGETLRRPEVGVVVHALRTEVASRRDELMGRGE
ncbi:LysR family transcriptional regulator [Rhodococcus sp. SORGH_AS_0301]|uniref:LysR family transcriptional regulator n=1 Tax=Rhodococcus sp. SORGH_AS_0301 TaxID=3041780 RepID=UPI0027880872|nr:LysR family transcriptional regulator [Rhodococcus sp. SORGH_AS_0301]MDQ1182341.1 DNA-binding transcriptional LysR family regulator [Rhodococcus sp. SORGH_AS_0301]